MPKSTHESRHITTRSPHKARNLMTWPIFFWYVRNTIFIWNSGFIQLLVRVVYHCCRQTLHNRLLSSRDGSLLHTSSDITSVADVIFKYDFYAPETVIKSALCNISYLITAKQLTKSKLIKHLLAAWNQRIWQTAIRRWTWTSQCCHLNGLPGPWPLTSIV